MSDLLKAISESAPYLMGDVEPIDGALVESARATPLSGFWCEQTQVAPCDAVETGAQAHGEVSRIEADAISSGTFIPRIRLLSSHELWVRQEDTTEYSCSYCGKSFRLQQGGALFDGQAACMCCEQHLNRDVVLPAINQARPLAIEPDDVGDAARANAIDGSLESAEQEVREEALVAV